MSRRLRTILLAGAAVIAVYYTVAVIWDVTHPPHSYTTVTCRIGESLDTMTPQPLPDGGACVPVRDDESFPYLPFWSRGHVWKGTPAQ